jgi:oligopeptidase B
MLGGCRPENFITKHHYAITDDGAETPTSLVYRKALKRNGNYPWLVDRPSSYGASMRPFFNSNIVSLLDRGFVYPIAPTRGGIDMTMENCSIRKIPLPL